MKERLGRYGTSLSTVAGILTAFWLLMLVVFPYFGMFEQSFRPSLPVTDVGGPKDHYFLGNYLSIFENPQEMIFGLFGLDLKLNVPVRLWSFFITLIYSSLVTVLALAICYPLAFYMAKLLPPKKLPTLIAMILIPLWVSELLRSFALYLLLGFNGPLSAILKNLGLIDRGIRWTWGLGGYSGVVLGLIYTYILFMLFPIYNSMTSLDTNQIEASEDLGAKWWQTHRRVIAPHCKPGMASGGVSVFMLSCGSILVPAQLGSPKSRWFTEDIQQWMLDSFDWNSGAAYALILMVACTIFVTLMMRFFKVGLADIAN